MIPEEYAPLLDGDYSFLPDGFFDDYVIYFTQSLRETCQSCERGGRKHNGIWINETTGKKLCEECVMNDAEFEAQIIRSNT